MNRQMTDDELRGRTIGHLTLLEPTRERTIAGRTWISWRCRCVCGKEVKRRESDLTAAIRNGKRCSCGCKFYGASTMGTGSPHWKGCGELNATYYNIIKDRCKRSGRELNVSIEYMWELYVKQGRKCALTGLPIGFATYRQRLAGVGDNTASLDRIDSDKGYVEGNVQWVHKDVNLMKNHFEQERFIEVCRLVAQTHPGGHPPQQPSETSLAV